MLTPRKFLKTIYHSCKDSYETYQNQQIEGIKSLALRDILLTNPVETDDSESFGLHMICCEQDFDMSLWALKTFYYYSETLPKLYIHNDGSLTDRNKKIYQEHFPKCRLIDRDEADQIMDTALKNYPLCRKYRKLKNFYCSLKLFDTFHFSETEQIFNLDSDILFFKKPYELLECLTNRQPFFMRDYQNSYTCDPKWLYDTFSIKVEEHANAGLTGIPKQAHFDHLDMIERYFEAIKSLNYTRDVNRHEQTINIILLSKLKALRLSHDYQLSHRAYSEQTVSHHYVNDGARKLYYLKGIKLLIDRQLTMELV